MAADHSDWLASWVQHGKKILTYRLMSRELRIHVDEAKEAMQAYYDATRSELNSPHATFSLIGDLKQKKVKVQVEDVQMEDATTQDSQSSAVAWKGSESFLSDKMKDKQLDQEAPMQGILLASETRLEEIKAKFSQINSCHIYSLQPGPLKDAALLTNIQHELHTTQKYIDTWAQTGRGKELGVILNEDIKDNYDPTKHLPSLAGPSAPALLPKKDDKKKPEPSKDPVVRKEQAKPAASAPLDSKPSSGAKKGGLDWSRAKPKRSTPATSKGSTKGTKRKNDSDKDDDNEDGSVIDLVSEDDMGPSRRNGKGKNSNSRAALLGEDEDEEDESDDGGRLGYDVEEEDDQATAKAKPGKTRSATGTSKRAEASKKTKEEERQKALEEMMDVDDDPDAPAAAEPSTSMMKGTAEATQVNPKRRVRKKRSIGKKKVRRKDDRGYMVTEMVEEYESYSSDESDAPPPERAPKAKAAAAQRSASSSTSASPAPLRKALPTPDEPKKSSGIARKPSTGSAPAKKGQQSLSSFFTKK